MSFDELRNLLDRAQISQVEVQDQNQRLEAFNQLIEKRGLQPLTIPPMTDKKSSGSLEPFGKEEFWGGITVQNMTDEAYKIEISFNPFNQDGFIVKILDHENQIITEKKIDSSRTFSIRKDENGFISLNDR